MRVPLSLSGFNSSDIFSLLQPNYIERIYTYKYYDFNDVLKGIGGLNAFIGPIIAKIAPYFIIYFLYSLAKIIIF